MQRLAGRNDRGQLGDGSPLDGDRDEDDYGDVLGISNAVDVRAGFESHCALNSNGQINCWGARTLPRSTTTQSSARIVIENKDR